MQKYFCPQSVSIPLLRRKYTISNINKNINSKRMRNDYFIQVKKRSRGRPFFIGPQSGNTRSSPPYSPLSAVYLSCKLSLLCTQVDRRGDDYVF